MRAITRENTTRASALIMNTNSKIWDILILAMPDSIVPIRIEITSINNEYLRRGTLMVETLGRGFAWLDTGNHDMLLEAADFVAAFQKRQGLYISCIEEIAYRRGFIDKDQLLKLAEPLMKTAYGQYLVDIANGL